VDYVIKELSNKTPFVLVQNVFDENELDSIHKELDFLQSRENLWLDPKDSGAAKDLENMPLKKNKGIWVNSIYANPEASAILTNNMKLYNSGVAQQIAMEHSWFEYFLHNAEFTTLLSYYEDSDHYKPHRDHAVLTTLTWLYKEPKKFEGGDLILNDEATVACTNNMTLIIPSTCMHEVTPILLEEEARGQGLGRYTITTFISVKPTAVES